MLCEITVGPDYLRADLFNRNTPEETRDALVAIAAEARRHRFSQILISVHASRPIFKIEQSGLLDFFKRLGDMSKYRIALAGDSQELRLSQQYVEVVARRHGINVRSFANPGAALDWFKDRRWLPDRRGQREAWEGKDKRHRPRRGSESRRPNPPGDVSP